MNKFRFPLTEPFQSNGRWWLPGNPDKRVHGILNFAADELSLTLYGSLVETSFDELGRLQSDFRRISLIHGTLDGGYSCTVFDAAEIKHDINQRDGTIYIAYSAIYSLIGCHTQSLDELRLTSISLCVRHLDAFINRQVMEVTHSDNHDWTIKYHHPSPVHFRVEPLKATLEIDSDAVRSSRPTSESIAATACFDITPDEPQLMQWFILNVWRLCDLLTLLTDESVAPTSIRVRLGHDELFDGWLLYRVGKPSNGTEQASSFMLLFVLAHVIDIFPSILDEWFSADNALTHAIHLFVNAHRDGSASADRFLNATKALEAYSRATPGSEYISADQFEQLEQALLAAIPQTIGCDMYKSLERRLHFANEHSFRKRLNNLIKSLSEDAIKIVCKKRANFVDGLVATRNYLTHYSDDPDTKPLDAQSRYWACEKMLLLLRILLLRRVGLDETLIVRHINENHRLIQYLHLWKQHPESVPVPKVKAAKTSDKPA